MKIGFFAVGIAARDARQITAIATNAEFGLAFSRPCGRRNNVVAAVEFFLARSVFGERQIPVLPRTAAARPIHCH